MSSPAFGLLVAFTGSGSLVFGLWTQDLVLSIDIGRLSPAFPVTPPYIRVRIRRFGE